MAAQTITGLTLTQLTDGTHKVNVQATVADADSDILSLAYQFKRPSESTWRTAVTDGPAATTAVASTALDFDWDLDASSVDLTTTATFNFRIVATKAAVAATGSLTAVAADTTTGLNAGDSFEVGGVTFEFTVGAGTPAAGNTAVVLATATDDATAVKAAIIAAINGASACTVTAASGSGDVVTLTSDVAGVAGNVAVEELIDVEAVTLTPVGMAGGEEAVVVSASGTVTDATTGAPGPVDESIDSQADAAAALSRSQNRTISLRDFEGLARYGKGSLPANYLKGAIVYKALDALRAGTYDKFEYDAWRSESWYKRAVLISVSEFNRITTDDTVTATLKSKRWLSNVGYRALSSVSVGSARGANTVADGAVYAIYEDTTTQAGGTLVANQTVIAYFMSLDKYTELLGG